MSGKFVAKTEKICSLCGKKFIPASNRQKYCPGPHYKECSICGKPFIFKVSDPNIKVCSEKCRIEQIKRTSEERYGETNYAKTKEFHDRLIAHNQEKYGTNCYLHSEEGKQKVSRTMIERYGTTVPLQNEAIKEKFLRTNNERYGGNSATSCKEVRDKVKKTNDERYGGTGAGSTILKQKIESTNLEKYGNVNPAASSKVRSKIMATNMEKYNAPAYIFSDEYILPRLKHQDKIDEYVAFRNDPVSYINSRFDHKPTIAEIASASGADIETIRLTIHKHNIEDKIEFFRSTIENEVLSFLYSLGLSENDILTQTHSIIPPYELDFYIPNYRLAIECNPSATHNSSIPFMNDSRIKVIQPSYHKMKSKMCKEKDIFLFHLFGYEWANRREVIESILSNMLGKSTQRYYARKLEVREISSQAASQFLNSNHRQRCTNSSVRLGLFDIDHLVSVMTFGKLRPTQGKKDKDEWELSRFCSELNTSVVGGASKLFKAFVDRYQPESVVSFSDVARSKGTLYETLGFEQVSQSDPGYVWVTLDDTVYYNRVSCQKSNLKNLLKDDSIDLTKTERQIMIEHGYVQVYDCGVIRWECRV